MDMNARNQYLEELRKEYLQSSKKEKNCLLTEAEKRTGLARKHLIVKLSAKNRFVKKVRKPRKSIYNGEVISALVKIWGIFDCPCGQRLKTLLETEAERLRKFKEIIITDKTAFLLKTISPKSIDRLLIHEKEQRLLKRKLEKKKHPWLYSQVSIKTSADFDRNLIGQEQIDLVEHCGSSAKGDFLSTLSITDIAVGWWEGEAVMGKSQRASFDGMTSIRLRSPIVWKEIHPDNDTAFINWHMYEYARQEELEFSRSRPYKKNDNCFVEQKNSTHVRQVVGYCRYDTLKEQQILNGLYRNELRLYKNFFQPVMKLMDKTREKGRIHRKYDKPITPYQRIMDSKDALQETKQTLKQIYENLNPAELKRQIDAKLKFLYQFYQRKQNNINPKTINNFKILKPNFGKKIYDPTTLISVR